MRDIGRHQKTTRALPAFLALLALILALGIVPVPGVVDLPGVRPTSAIAEEAQDSSLQQRLSAIEGVTSVTPIEQVPLADGTLPFKEKYLVTIEQPIDWDDPGLGTFEQRVEVGYQGDTNVNVYQVDGYMLFDTLDPDYMTYDDRNELSKTYDANLINVEYRFFGKSTPAGLSNTSTDLWEYLTVENAARDFHAIIGKIGQVLSGKRVFTGASKGGYSTNVQACLYPDDADAFVSYVAPLCDGTQDRRFYRNVYETIGDTGMSAEQAEECRDLVLQFQVECIKNQTTLVERQKAQAKQAGYTFGADDDVIFDMRVADFAASEWQYYQDFDTIRTVLQETDPQKRADYIWALLQYSPLYTYAKNGPFFPYYVQASTQEGENYLDFSYLRQALKDAYDKDKAIDPTVDEKDYELSVTPEMEDNLLQKVMLTDEQRAAWHYSSKVNDELIAWSKTTTAHVVMLYGGTDPWYAVRIPDTTNPSIHRYVAPTKNHGVQMSDLTTDEQAELSSLLDSWLIDYDVTFDMHGVGAAPDTEVVGKGLAATRPDDPSASGYTFGGWYVDSACTEAYDFDTPVIGDLTLHAKWTAVIPEPQPQTGLPASATAAATDATVTNVVTAHVGLPNTSDRTMSPIVIGTCAIAGAAGTGTLLIRRRRRACAHRLP
jgi:uncharacterized repeat protein (TIGR02543 family)